VTERAASRTAGRRSPNATLLVLALAGLVYATVQSAVLPALPTLQHDLHTSVDGASWILITYLLSASVATPIIGRLGDIYGKDRMLVVTLAAVTLGTLLAAVANSIVLLDFARVIQGIGGGVIPLSFGIIRDEFPPRRVATSIGIVSSMLGIGGGIGIVAGAVILEQLSWHWLFWLPLVPTVLAVVLAYVFVPPSPVRTPARINWASAVLMTVGMSAVLIAVSEAATWGWASAKTLALIAAGLLVVAAWIAWEVRSDVALVDMRLMRLRPVWTTNLAATLLGGGLYALFLIVPEFVQEPRSTGYGLGASVVQSGLYLLPLSATMLLMSLQAGRIAHRFGSKAALVSGALTSGASFVLLLVAHGRSWDFYASSTLFGLGMGLSFSALGNLIVDAVPRTHTGVASGMNAVMRTLGGAFGAAFVATFIAGRLVNGQPAESGYLLAIAVSASLLGLAGLAGLLIPRRGSEPVAVGSPTVGVARAATASAPAEAPR
jgi:EmrB/QacA subfamily drug resistance transporter